MKFCFCFRILASLVLLNPVFPVAADFTLSEIVNLALQNAGSVRMQELAMSKARHSLAETRSSLLPTLDLQASFTLMSDPPEGIIIRKGSLGYAPALQSQYPVPLPDQDYVIIEDSPPTYFKITTTFSQPVFTWHKIENAITISRLDYEAASLSLNKTKAELTRDVAVLYHSQVLAVESLIILKQAQAVLKEILEDKQASFDEGYINRQEVLTAVKNLAQMNTLVIRSGESCLSGLAGLAFYTGLPEAELRLSSCFRTTLPLLDEERINRECLADSPGLAVLKKQQQQAAAYVAIEQASSPFKPDLSLIASFDITGQEIPFAGGNWPDTWNHNLSLSLAGRVKLYDGGKSAAKTKAALDSAAMAAQSVDQLERGLKLQVRKAIAEVKTAYYTLLEKQAIRDEAGETSKNAGVSFENELITRGEERSARVLLYSSELESLLAGFNYESALIRLEYLWGQQL